MNFHRTVIAAVAAAAFASGSGMVMAETRTLDVNIEANVAVDGLLVSPVAGWHNNTQTMSWDHSLQQLTPITRQITMRNTTGAINAHLVAPARLTNGANGIDLVVKVNGATLTTTSAPIVTAGDAATVRNVDFNVTATAPGGATPAWVSGNYTGTVYMMFEGV